MIIEGIVENLISSAIGAIILFIGGKLLNDYYYIGFNFSNKKDVALKMENISNVDGVNVDSMNASTYEDTKSGKFNITIEALGYAAPNSTSGQIVISQKPSYKVIVSSVASYKNDQLVVDTDQMKVNSVLKLF